MIHWQTENDIIHKISEILKSNNKSTLYLIIDAALQQHHRYVTTLENKQDGDIQSLFGI